MWETEIFENDEVTIMINHVISLPGFPANTNPK